MLAGIALTALPLAGPSPFGAAPGIATPTDALIDVRTLSAALQARSRVAAVLASSRSASLASLSMDAEIHA